MKVALLLSGGVDSSVALHLLKEAGHDVTAYYLKIWLEDELSFLGNCPWEEDLKYARDVCAQLDTPLEIINMQQEYLDTVVEYTLSELKTGHTPSPDIMCNRHIKFDRFFDKIDGNFDKAASGHYARIEEKNGKYHLLRAPDPIKDQTYFLTYLKQEQLSRIIFPIGGLSKAQVRHIADKANLPTRYRKDSQGICFLGKINYNDFIRFHLGEKQGDIIELESGKKLGTHKGFWFYTIGQRQGLGLGGGPWYVVKKGIDDNIIYISKDKYSLDIPRDVFYVRDANWIPDPPGKKVLQVKLRHGRNKYKCSIEYEDDRVKVQLEKKDLGLAPGQFAIFYNSDYCLGGGVIELTEDYEV